MKRLVWIWFLFFLLVIASPVYPAFLGPQTIIEGRCGTEDADFGCQTVDSDDVFLFILCIDELGNIVIGDGANSRIKIYDPAGIWERNFSYQDISPVGSWPQNLRVKADTGIFSIYEKLQKYDYHGNLVFTIQVPGTMDYWIAGEGSIWLQEKRDKFIKYSATGDLLNTVAEKPLELGVVIEKRIASLQYEITIKYPDKRWEIVREGPFSAQKYIRDLSGNLYGIGSNYVVRYDDQGKELGKLMIPAKKLKGSGLPFNLAIDEEPPRLEILESYGTPVVSPNGDIFTWKRTPDRYYIIKWVWQ